MLSLWRAADSHALFESAAVIISHIRVSGNALVGPRFSARADHESPRAMQSLDFERHDRLSNQNPYLLIKQSTDDGDLDDT